MALDRDDDSLLARWWFTLDRVLLGLVLALFAVGLVVSLAASPAVAVKRGFSAFHFVERHVAFAAVGLTVMLALSFATPRLARRLALLLFLASLVGLSLVLAIGEEVNGAKRWLRFSGVSMQPSEFLKPALIVLSGWALAAWSQRRNVPALPIAVALAALPLTLIAAEPDVGQTTLIATVWGAMLVLAGLPLWVATLMGFAGLGGLGFAYWRLDYVRERIDPYLFGGTTGNSQVDQAVRSFVEGGFLGRGPGEGRIKTTLPDAHTDFIFAVIAEEYGVLACLALLCLFLAIALRMIRAGLNSPQADHRLALFGLALIVALQALVNMGVNVGVVPATGMTLPLVSAGGSSMLSVSVTFGLALALSRRRPDGLHLQLPPLPVTRGMGD